MESELKKRNVKRHRRTLRVRKTLCGNSQKPRLSVFHSNKHLFAQLIDDETHTTLFGIGTLSKEFKGKEFAKKSKAAAKEIGARIANEAKKKNIETVVFDRGSHKYHGLLAELANAAREAGLKF